MRNAAPKSAESGSTSRAFGPTSRRTTCGTTSPTKPMSPASATAAAVTSDGEAEEDRALPAHVDAEVARRVIAQEQRVERAGTREDEAAADDDDGQAHGEALPVGLGEAAQQVEEDLAQVRAREVHRDRQARPPAASRPRSR